MLPVRRIMFGEEEEEYGDRMAEVEGAEWNGPPDEDPRSIHVFVLIAGQP